MATYICSNDCMGIFDFLKKNDELEQKLNEKISKLEADIRRKDKEISDLIDENEAIKHGEDKVEKQSEKIYSKQVELFEKNLKDAREENLRLKYLLQQYNIKYSKEKHYYKVDISKFFASAKFSEINEYLSISNIKYVQDLTEEFVEKMSPELKNIEEAKQKIENFWSKKFIEWDIVTYMNRGEKISRIYSKSRKFINILNEEGIEFIEDLKDYDFSKLTDKGFDNKKIKELKELRDATYKEERVVVTK